MFLNKSREFYIRIFMILLFAGIIVLCVFLILTPITVQNDVLQINRIENQVSTHFDDLESCDFSSFSYPFSVLDAEDNVIFTCHSPITLSVYDAMRYSDIILPLQHNDTNVGTLLIQTHTVHEHLILSNVQRYGTVLIITFIIAFTVVLFYDLYLNRTILKPFYKLTDFITRISHSDLDASLDIQGSSTFVPFVQGLDVMREELRFAKQREYEANLSKKSLVASLSHDIKTPVTSIRLAVELMQLKETDPMMLEKLHAIMAKTEQIDHLVTDLFHTTMDDLEELPISCKDIYSNELTRLIQEADLNHCVQSLVVPDCMIHIDPIRMGQIFTNIIYNSYKYAGTDMLVDGTIDDEYLNLTFRDFGPGVDSEELPCIFNRFYRGKNVGNQTGSGLGLYICKSLADKMNCEIYCNNLEDGFLTLIKIPLV